MPEAWGLTGVTTLQRTKLSDDTWEHVRNIVKAETGARPPSDFHYALVLAVGAYEAVTELKKTSASPAKARRELEKVAAASRDLVKMISKLDGNSRQFLAIGEPGGMSAIYDHLGAVAKAAASAAQRVAQYRDTKPIDYAQLQLGIWLAEAIATFLGIRKITKKRNGLFEQLFIVLIEEATGKQREDVHDQALKAIDAWREERTPMPSLEWLISKTT